MDSGLARAQRESWGTGVRGERKERGNPSFFESKKEAKKPLWGGWIFHNTVELVLVRLLSMRRLFHRTASPLKVNDHEQSIIEIFVSVKFKKK